MARECTPTGKLFAVQCRGTLHRRRVLELGAMRSNTTRKTAAAGNLSVCAVLRHCCQRLCAKKAPLHENERSCTKIPRPMSAIKASLVRDLAAALSPAPDNVGHRGRRGQFSRPSRRSYRTALRWSNRRRPPSGTQASWPGPLIIYAAWGVPSDLPFGETWAMALEPDGSGAKASDGCATRRALGEASGPP